MNFHAITTNLNVARTRRDSLEGRDCVVVPMVMLTEGVHSGSRGPLYYPGEELAKSPEVWNHKPVVVNHPTLNGAAVSACDPVVLSSRKIGLVLNTRWDSRHKKLRAEAWLDPPKTELVDDRVMDAIRNHRPLELSTGLFADYVPEEGTWNNKPYKFVARNYKPDHLAVLPDQVGACSMADGAGFLRNSAPAAQWMKDFEKLVGESVGIALKRTGILLNSEASPELREALFQVLTKNQVGMWVEDVYPEHVILNYRGQYLRQGYRFRDGELTLIGDPTEVSRTIQYVAATEPSTSKAAEPTTNQEKSMSKELIDGIIADANSQWQEGDRSFLEGLAPEHLSKLKTPAQTTTTVNTTSTVVAPKTLESFVASAPAEFQAILNQGLAAHKQEKDRHIAVIIANDKCKFTKEVLEAKPLEELQAIAALCEAAPAEKPVPNYAGAATPVGNSAKTEQEEKLELPTMNFESR